jgi:DNA-binding FadR family transcriptional regulator
VDTDGVAVGGWRLTVLLPQAVTTVTELRPGQAMLGEGQLVSEYRIGTTTARKALAVLHERGLIVEKVHRHVVATRRRAC